MELDFSKSPDGLLPAIVQDVRTKTVLMLGYMNVAALEKTQTTGQVTFYSRSKQRLWTKGEESGKTFCNWSTSRLIVIKTPFDSSNPKRAYLP